MFIKIAINNFYSTKKVSLITQPDFNVYILIKRGEGICAKFILMKKTIIYVYQGINITSNEKIIQLM